LNFNPRIDRCVLRILYPYRSNHVIQMSNPDIFISLQF